MIILPRKLVLWILGGIIAICVITGACKAGKALGHFIAEYNGQQKKVDIGLGYTPPPDNSQPELEKEKNE